MTLETTTTQNVSAGVLRLDRIHPVVSGNKWFKLKYYLQDAVEKNHHTVISFGGAWSNHIVATAFACREAGLKSIGVIRGEQPVNSSHTLRAAAEYGMQLEFVDRNTFRQQDKTALINKLADKWGPAYIVPEGGAGTLGVRGSKEILALVPAHEYSHFMCCIGTGTMFAGLVNASLPGQQVIGIPVLKGMHDLPEQCSEYFEDRERLNDCRVFYDYHFGGYAKKIPALIGFMNRFYEETGIPTDFVYTAKLMFAFTDLYHKRYFPPSSRILIIHSGGLQGNGSLAPGTLAY